MGADSPTEVFCMGADSPTENTPNASKNFRPKYLPKAQKFEIKKKLSLGVRSPWFEPIKASSVRLGRFGRYIV